MRVRVAYTVEVGNDAREAIRSYYGQSGLASREEVRDWYRQYGQDNGNMVLGDEMLLKDQAEKSAKQAAH